MTRPFDYGDQYPSDQGDLPPDDPSLQFVERDFDISGRRVKPADKVLQPIQPFAPNRTFRVPEYAPNLKNAWYGVIAGPPTWVSSVESGIANYAVTRQDGANINGRTTQPHITLEVGDYVIVFEDNATERNDDFIIFSTKIELPRERIIEGVVADANVASKSDGVFTSSAFTGQKKFRNWSNGQIDVGETIIVAWANYLGKYLVISANCET